MSVALFALLVFDLPPAQQSISLSPFLHGILNSCYVFVKGPLERSTLIPASFPDAHDFSIVDDCHSLCFMLGQVLDRCAALFVFCENSSELPPSVLMRPGSFVNPLNQIADFSL